MGRDKALLPHPEGGSWLERTLRLLLDLQIPVTLLSRHERHLQMARALNREWSGGGGTGSPRNDTTDAPGALETLPGPAAAATRQRDAGAEAGRPPITALAEEPPWEGPLLALQRLMRRHPDERLLLCPVDMPDLNLAALEALLAAAAQRPDRLHLAHDGERLQPLLGVYPSVEPLRCELTEALQRGERRLQSWLATQPIQAVRLDPDAIRNVNRPAEAARATSAAWNAQAAQ